ncbi:MAG: MFS transporter [Bacteroidales bacterium]|jgi:MFS family permease
MTLISLILAGEAIFFLPFVLARIFRPTLLIVFNITNTELGTWFSVYGIVAMAAYFFGGPLADRFPARNLIALALWLTSAGGFLMAFVPGNGTMPVLYGFWGLTTIFLFWAALIRATREWGGKTFQGRGFGWLEGGRGFTAALIGTFSLFLFSQVMPEHPDGTFSGQRIASFKQVITAASCIVLLCGVLVRIFVPGASSGYNRSAVSPGMIRSLLAKPVVWMLSVIILCAYVGYKITDVFSLYANEILGFNEVGSAGVGTAALWMRALVAVVAGYLADRFRAGKVIMICFALSVLGGLMIVFGLVDGLVIPALVNLSVIMAGVYGVRALYFALISEEDLSLATTGTIVGIVSVIGFTPDIFMSPWMGYLLDSNPGITGYRYVFMVLASFSVIGFLISLLLPLPDEPGNVLKSVV